MSTIPTPALFAQRYRIINYLGDSRTASVHRADDVRLQRTVLLHTQHRTTPPLIQHGGLRGLLRVYDSGVLEDGRAYTITEDVSGQALADVAPLTPLQAITVARAAATTVIDVQAQGLPHPPITTRNVWLFDHDRIVLLDDWHVPAAERTQLEAAYRAPEATGGTTTPASTVYALGVLLREALTGSTAAGRAAHVPLQLARIIERAMASTPQQRFPTPDALAQALHQYAANIDTPTAHMPFAAPAHMPPAQPATMPMARPAPRPQPVPVAPPRQTKVMVGPPPSIPVPAAPVAATPAAQGAVQRVRGWQMPRVHIGPWQRALLHRGWWLAQRVVLIGLILIGLNLAYTAISVRARSINAGQWVADNTPQFDWEQWIAAHTPDIHVPDVNIGAWAQQKINSLRENVSSEINNVGAFTTYRVTQQINLRSTPSATDAATIIAQLPAGTRVQQIGTPQADTHGNDYQWIRVTVLDGNQEQTGWVALLPNRLERE